MKQTIAGTHTDFVDLPQLYKWCSIRAEELPLRTDLRVPYRQVADASILGALMAEELSAIIKSNNRSAAITRAIIPCGPKCWYEPFANLINLRKISLKNLFVFHMDECLDWQGQLLPRNHPYNFRTFMEHYFYNPIDAELSVPEGQRYWLTPATVDSVRNAIAAAPIDITMGGWGQDGHVAYNQARRTPFHHLTLNDLRNSTIRIQENNLDTLIALAHRSFGAAYQFVPPMSVTLGLRECFSARKIRLYSDTGAWKQTALRVALFSDPVPEYPMTLLQTHPDAMITATLETARHPISENPDWSFFEIMRSTLKTHPIIGFTHVVGIGGIGSGVLFQLEGDHTLGRDESRLGQLLPARDYCKLHIVEHYIAALMGSGKTADACKVLAIGVIGNDAAGRQLLQEMEGAGIGTEWVRVAPDRPTLYSVSFLYPDGAGGNITAGNSAASILNLHDICAAEEVMTLSARHCVALCLPEVPLEIRHEFLKLATRHGNFRAASFVPSEIPRATELGLFPMVDLLALNREEAAGLVGYEYSSQNAQRFLSDCASILRKMQPGIRIVISVGAEGAHAFEDGSWSYRPAPAVQVVSTAGAGDALLAGVLSGLASGLSLNAKPTAQEAFTDAMFSSALELGMLLASFSITSPDTIHFDASLARLEEFASTLNSVS